MGYLFWFKDIPGIRRKYACVVFRSYPRVSSITLPAFNTVVATLVFVDRGLAEGLFFSPLPLPPPPRRFHMCSGHSHGLSEYSDVVLVRYTHESILCTGTCFSYIYLDAGIYKYVVIHVCVILGSLLWATHSIPYVHTGQSLDRWCHFSTGIPSTVFVIRVLVFTFTHRISIRVCVPAVCVCMM